MISEAFTPTPATIGFRRQAKLDDSPQMQERVREAVSRAQVGDRDALRFLYVSYSQNVYGYVRSILHDDHEAEDVTQQVFTKLITTLARYEDRGGPFFAWLLRLARNVAIDHLRGTRRARSEPIGETDTAVAPDLDRAETVRRALAKLPDEQKAVVILRHVVGLTPGEIATQMGRSERSIHGLHHRGRRALRLELTRLDSVPCTQQVRQPIAA